MSRDNELTRTAGAFDIRTVIAVLLGIFGIILTILGLVDYSAEEAERTGGIDANLWTGISLIVVSILFIVWARLRPIRIVVDETPESIGETGTDTP